MAFMTVVLVALIPLVLGAFPLLMERMETRVVEGTR